MVNPMTSFSSNQNSPHLYNKHTNNHSYSYKQTVNKANNTDQKISHDDLNNCLFYKVILKLSVCLYFVCV